MSEISQEQVWQALRGVIDPARGADVVSLGLVQGLVVRDGHVGFALEVPASEGAAKEPLRAACEAAVARLPGVRQVTAVLTAHRAAPGQTNAGQVGAAPPRAAATPAATSRPAAAHSHERAHERPQAQPALPEVGAIIAVASGKGGVGKSTVAVNLALGLSALGLRVGLLDADVYGPSVPRLLGLKGRPTSPDGKRLAPMERYGLRCMSIGFLVEEDTPMIWRGPMVVSALNQMMSEVLWGPLDVLVVDMPPGTGDAQLTMAQRVPLAGAVIVSTPQDIALIDARKGLAMFRKTEVPVLGIVENMSLFVCPNCGHEAHIFGHGGARATAAELGCDFLGEIPLDLAIRESSDAGTPVVATAPDSPPAQAFLALAARVAGKLAEAQGTARTPPRIVVE